MNDLILDLQKLRIKNIGYDREKNIVTVGNMEIRGLSIYESCICHGMRNIKYFIDGIDMKIYKDADEKHIDSLIYHVKDIMSHFRKDTKQLTGKDELIEILMEDVCT